MKNNQTLINRISTQLQAIYDKDESDAVARILLERFLKSKHSESVSDFNTEWTDEQESYLNQCLERLTKSEPLQYVIGEAWFNNLKFKVNTDVLIPRPETEELVHWVIDDYKRRLLRNGLASDNKASGSNFRILDIGTGSGCIAVSLCLTIPESEVYALDISKDALQVANENAAAHGVQIHFINDDILNPSPVVDDINYDCIVSNPPYITRSEIINMHKNVLDFEPHVALFVDNKNPLLFYEAIASFAMKKLVAGGSLFFEINKNQKSGAMELLRQAGFVNVECRTDISGNDRMIRCNKPL